jgi:signal transduction histidine kinase
VITLAVHRVEARWRQSFGASAEVAILTRMLAVGDASFVDRPTPRPPLRLSLYLVHLLEDELLTSWRGGESSATDVLAALDRVRQIRAAIEGRLEQLPGAPLVGLDGLEFLVEFVHDLRSPLTSLQLLADRLQQGLSGPLTALQRRQLRLIYGAAHALNTLTANAFQMTHEWDHLEEPEPRPFSVTRLLSDVLDVVRTLAEQKGLELNFIRPDADRRLGHPIELQRILLNLVTNSLKFTRAGSIRVSASDQDDTRIEFAVEDTGPGIPPFAQESLFQPFRRSGADGRAVFSGTGLGLALTQRLVRALGGELLYDTAEERGTRFYFVLELPVP